MKAFLPAAGKIIALLFAFNAVTYIQAQTTHSISVNALSFSPDNLEISAGDTVVWTNSSDSHNVNGTQGTFPDNPASFGNDVGTNWTYSFVFTEPGTYNYQCDPHASAGMDGQIIVTESGGGQTNALITFDLTSMNPHLNQDIWFALIDQESGEILQRIHNTITTADFSVEFAEVATGGSYNIDFYADHNHSGNYNSPPTDHAWRIELDNLTGDTTLTFVHNTTFTDIQWKHGITVDFSAMDPHLGQMLFVYVIDTINETYIDTITIDEITEAEFSVVSYAADTGGSYRIDFYADHNGNGTYDAPPTDHAWRIEIATLIGDTIIPFVHNTEFTNIFDTPTGVNNKEIVRITLYPNPTGDYVRVSGNDLPAGDLNVRIFSLAGQVVRSMKATNNGYLTLNLTGLSKGAYYLTIESAGFRANAKFVKSY
jgi:plastocyanin